jgi:hypothetical protein
VIIRNQIALIGEDEKAFFIQLGAHIAASRQAQNIVQVLLAEPLSLLQQTINTYVFAQRDR